MVRVCMKKCEPFFQLRPVNPFPCAILLFQPNPQQLVEFHYKVLVQRQHNTKCSVLQIELPKIVRIMRITQKRCNLLFSAVDHHQVRTSPQAVSSTAEPRSGCGRDVIQTGEEIYPSFSTVAICSAC